MENTIIDTNSLIYFKNKSSTNWEKHNFLLNKLSKILYTKLIELGSYYKNILLLSSDSGEALNDILGINFKNIIFLSPYKKLLEKVKDKENILKVESHFENIPCKNDKFDLVISNLYLHNVNKKKNHLKKLFNLLNPDGLLICNFFGEKTLYELKNSLFATDEQIFNGVFMRLAPSLKMVDISAILSEVGLKELVSEKISYTIYYDHVKKIFEDLKGTGENNVLINRSKGLMTANYIKTLNKQYLKMFGSENGLKLTCDIISICGWKNTRS